MTPEEIYQLSGLVETMQILRSQTGCPWDREQSPESLRPYILEEAYELIDAIDAGHPDEILSELGDLLLQVVFQAQIFNERGLFGIGDVAKGINAKLIRRHPHIFSSDNTATQHPDWEQIKQQELQEKGKTTDYGSRQPANLPALKLADKCSRYLSKNRTPPDKGTQSNPSSANQADLIDEQSIAKNIFQLVTLAQQHNIDCELALRKYTLNLLLKAGES